MSDSSVARAAQLAQDVPSFEGSMVFTSSEDDHVSAFTLARFEELNGDDPMLRVWSDQLRALEPGGEVEIAWFTFRRVHLRLEG
jgi:hypothetical protein